MVYGSELRVSSLGFRVQGSGCRVQGEGRWSPACSNMRLRDSCITQLKAQGPSRTCDESKEEEEEVARPRPA